MLSKQAIDSFLTRSLKDSGRAKELSDDVLDSKLEKYKFQTSPRKAQKVCFLLGMKYPRYEILLGTGGGKTKVSLDIFINRNLKRLLVVVPNVVNLYEWKKQIAIHASDLSAEAVDCDGKESRLQVVLGGTSVVIVTYQGLSQLCSETEPGKKGTNRWVSCKESVVKVGSAFDMMVLDESTSIKNHQSLHFKVIRGLSKHIEFIYGLTGTPFDKNPIDMWSQMHIIDNGHSLGDTLGLFRNVFCRETHTPWKTEYKFLASKKELFSRRLRHSSVRYSEAECQDLPAAVGGLSGGEFMLLEAVMSSQHRKYYQAFNKELQSIQFGNVSAISAAYTRMRMVSSGWLGAVDEDNERIELTFKNNPKLDAVIAKLHELEDEKVIVVHWFNHSGKIICDRLDKEKIKHTWVYGGSTSSQKMTALEKFLDPKGPRVLVASTAISKGVNLQSGARYMIFFESPDSVIERKQMEARILREGGLEGHRYYYDAVCLDSKDQAILESLKTGKRLFDLIVDRT